ncbi:pantoate--beta-alanine ligase [Sphingomonas sediminicola]|uniref:pantoate--beta-alanine ligase n=1 Tax=Sphingomonas sediminicola TaxID=386874 RepID=UPI003CF47876
MQIIREASQLPSALIAMGDGGKSLALVPTMGALHSGHLKLITEASRVADRVAATIFVNPLQFGANEDFDRYPRQEEKDAAMLEEAGCDLLWLPQPAEFYPAGFATTVSVKGVSDRWEGEARPGHFDGVATVVAKLLCAVRPDIALFGEKDFQQLAVIRRMALDLQLGIEVLGVPTVRDEDGLALSSRNAYLSPEERSNAVELPRALNEAAEAISSGLLVSDALAAAKARLTRAGFSRIDYVALVNALTLEPLEQAGGPMRLIAAALIGRTRLIDNIAVGL